MNSNQYQRILQPAIDAVIAQLIDNEFQYGEGIKHSKLDLLKCAGHAISAERGLDNPDGHSHATAAATDALKALLYEIKEGL